MCGVYGHVHVYYELTTVSAMGKSLPFLLTKLAKRGDKFQVINRSINFVTTKNKRKATSDFSLFWNTNCRQNL